ncbi:MAG TPA: universal stress protein, partial [Terriglobales bacterium]
SSCPVLTVGPHCVEDQAMGVKIDTILVATDFSHSAHHALTYALSLAEANHARLILIHAVPRAIQVVPSGAEIAGETMQIYDEIEAEDVARSRQEMTHLLDSGRLRGWTPETIIEVGPASDVILSNALKRKADLIVMGAHHRSAAASHIPWATASTVVANAHCPVLTVRT